MEQQSISINLKDSTGIVCSHCGNDIFVPGMMVRKISRLVTGSAKDIISPVQIPLCSKCMEPLDEVIPDTLRKPKIQI